MSQVSMRQRVVEVKAYMGEGVTPRLRYGSGLLSGDRTVLTAAHVVRGAAKVTVRRSDKQTLLPAILDAVLIGDPGRLDLALLEVPGLAKPLPHIPVAVVDRDITTGEFIEDCWAVGYPAFQEIKREGRSRSTRVSAQVHGQIPPLSGMGDEYGLLSLQVTTTPRELPEQGTLGQSEWSGMSGAAVFAGDMLVGVIAEHAPRRGASDITVTPLDRLNDPATTPPNAAQWWERLGVNDPATLPRLPAATRPGSVSPANLRRAWLRAYLMAARIVARRHPYAIALPGVPSLPAVYLRQQVGFQADQPASSAVADLEDRIAPIESEDEPLTLLQRRFLDRKAHSTADQITQVLQRFDVSEVLQHHPCGLIVGGPGSGKSSLMRNLVETTAGNWLDGKTGTFVPALINAQSLLQPLSFHEAVAGALRKDLGATLDNVDLDTFLAEPPLPGIPWLILLDGLDEIFDANDRRRVIEIITRWQEDPRYRFLIASRPLPASELRALRSPDLPAFEIQPFTDEQLPELAGRWFSALGLSNIERAVEQFIDLLLQTRIAQLARNPLVATITCVVFANNPGSELPRSRAELYEEFVKLLLRKLRGQNESLDAIKDYLGRYGEAARHAPDVLLSDLRSLIQELAEMRIGDSELSVRLAAEQLSAKYRPAQVPLDLWHQVVSELLRQSGLVSERFDDFAFSHDTIMEYLAACSRVTSFRPGVRERWGLVVRAGRNESFALFVVTLAHGRGIDLTRRIPAFLEIRKLLHARLVAAMAHDGCDLDPRVVRIVIDRLSAIATMKINAIPDILRRGPWLVDDCVMAAKSLMMLDKARGLKLLVRLAADPAVAGLNIFDVFGERMLTEDFTDIDPEQGLRILSEIASIPSDKDADPLEEGFTRTLIASLVYERDANAGLELIKTLAYDQSMVMSYRMDCVRALVDLDRASAIRALISLICDANARFYDKVDQINYLLMIDQPSARTVLERLALDSANSDFVRAMAGAILTRYAYAKGVNALRVLSCDRGVSGFHRVYHFVKSGTEFDRAHRLAELSADSTLPGKWRLFAADELVGCKAERGLSVLRVLKEDPSLDRRTRVKAGIRVAIYRRALRVLEVDDTQISYFEPWRLELRRFFQQLGELVMSVVRRK